LSSGGELVFVFGHKGLLRVVALQHLQGWLRSVDADLAIGAWSKRLCKRTVLGAIVIQPLQIDVCDQALRCEFKSVAFREHLASLCNQAMPPKHHILGGLQRAGTRIDIAAKITGAGHAYQIAPVVGLADEFVTRRKVADYVGSSQSSVSAGADGCP